MSNCRLCAGLLQGPGEAWNRPLLESKNFVVLPSLGALVEGWLLLVPKNHYICMGAIPDEFAVELQTIKGILCSALHQTYGEVCVFEHGPNRANLNIGCGVDHAHLHFLPLSFNLASAVSPFLPEEIFWSEANLEKCRDAYLHGSDYLYLEQPIGRGRIATHNSFGSQLFRRAIASQIGAINQFNWREFPQFQNVYATISTVQAWDGGMFSCITRHKAA